MWYRCKEHERLKVIDIPGSTAGGMILKKDSQSSSSERNSAYRHRDAHTKNSRTEPLGESPSEAVSTSLLFFYSNTLKALAGITQGGVTK